MPVRIHSECLTGDVFSSKKCDCGEQKSKFLELAAGWDCAVFVYIKGHEGRGCGLPMKIAAYRKMDEDPGLNHVSALKIVGFPQSDTRDYDFAFQKLKETIGADSSIVLFSNNEKKQEAAKRAFSPDRVTFRKMTATPNKHNLKYLREKEEFCGHVGLLQKDNNDSKDGPNGGDHSRGSHNGGNDNGDKDEGNSGQKEKQDKGDDSSGSGNGSGSGDAGGAGGAGDGGDGGDGGDRGEGGDGGKDTISMADMEIVVNRKIFERSDPDLFKFYKEHGWVAVRNMVPAETCEKAIEQYDKKLLNVAETLMEVAPEVGLTPEKYRKEVSQHRDLFMEGGTFKHLIYNGEPTSSLHFLAKEAMNFSEGWDCGGVQLFHDHIIAKPAGSNEKIPWHQDSMFWPVDFPGLSSWTPLRDVSESGGPLEVIDKSHAQNGGYCEEPVDFMAEEKNEFPKACNRRVLLPVPAGCTVLLHSLTWHRSSRSKSLNSDRPVHIGLWVPIESSWRPDLVSWHPINDFLTRKKHQPGKRLNCPEKHPQFGTYDEQKNMVMQKRKPPIRHRGTVRKGDISMFDASRIIGAQIRRILAIDNHTSINNKSKANNKSDSEDGAARNRNLDVFCLDIAGDEKLEYVSTPEDEKLRISDVLKTKINRARIIDLTIGFEICEEDQRDLLEIILFRIWLSNAAYDHCKARNVYNEAYASWWRVAGHAWNCVFQFEDLRLTIAEVRQFFRLINIDSTKYGLKLEDDDEKKQEEGSGLSGLREGEGSGRGDLDNNITKTKLDSSKKEALMREIIKGAMKYVPFQNFNMIAGKGGGYSTPGVRMRPSPREIVDDMITGKGGLCTTRNPFLYLLLKTLSYKVCFVSGTPRNADGKELKDAHIAMLVDVGAGNKEKQRIFWVDIGNGFPYTEPLLLTKSLLAVAIDQSESQNSLLKETEQIQHPYRNVKIVRRETASSISTGAECGNSVFEVMHYNRIKTNVGKGWESNYWFVAKAVPYSKFNKMHREHYGQIDFGPFLTGIRWNIWWNAGGVIVRDNDALELQDGKDGKPESELRKIQSAEDLEKFISDTMLCLSETESICNAITNATSPTNIIRKAWNIWNGRRRKM